MYCFANNNSRTTSRYFRLNRMFYWKNRLNVHHRQYIHKFQAIMNDYTDELNWNRIDKMPSKWINRTKEKTSENCSELFWWNVLRWFEGIVKLIIMGQNISCYPFGVLTIASLINHNLQVRSLSIENNWMIDVLFVLLSCDRVCWKRSTSNVSHFTTDLPGHYVGNERKKKNWPQKISFVWRWFCDSLSFFFIFPYFLLAF